MTRKTTYGILAALMVVLLAGGTTAFLFLKKSVWKGEQPVEIFLRPGEKAVEKLRQAGVSTLGWSALDKALDYHERPGRYLVNPGESILTVFRRFRNGQQEPVRLVLPSLRTMTDMAGFLGEHLMVDSASFARAFADSLFCDSLGYSPTTLPALFVPNTYEVYWNVSLSDFMQRMQREHDTFWNDERRALADSLSLTPDEVTTLASIIDEETANNGEKPMIAGMYLRRMELGMPLQADPTVKFAVGDFSLRRILKEHLTTISPYNTYLNEGLPPGPIRVASVAGIDAVLHRVRHNYVYMCAKEDFSGTHNFAATYAEHLANARRYQKALNERNIK